MRILVSGIALVSTLFKQANAGNACVKPPTACNHEIFALVDHDDYYESALELEFDGEGLKRRDSNINWEPSPIFVRMCLELHDGDR